MFDYHLNTFMTLSKYMNYRKTAEVLHMTQPAVTQHIQFLEKHYNCKLFVYDHRKLTMTRQAELLLSHAQNLKYQEQILSEKIAQRERPALHIGATKTIGEYVLGIPLAGYIKASKKELTITVCNTETLLTKINMGEIDFAIIEGIFDKSRYASELYQKEEFVGNCNRKHRFAGTTVSLEECFKERLLIRETGSGTRQIFESVLMHNNRSLNDFTEIICADSIGLIADLIENDCGITFAYKSMASQNKGLSTFQLEGGPIYHDYSVVYLDNEFARQTVKEFVDARHSF